VSLSARALSGSVIGSGNPPPHAHLDAIGSRIGSRGTVVRLRLEAELADGPGRMVGARSGLDRNVETKGSP